MMALCSLLTFPFLFSITPFLYVFSLFIVSYFDLGACAPCPLSYMSQCIYKIVSLCQIDFKGIFLIVSFALLFILQKLGPQWRGLSCYRPQLFHHPSLAATHPTSGSLRRRYPRARLDEIAHGGRAPDTEDQPHRGDRRTTSTAALESVDVVRDAESLLSLDVAVFFHLDVESPNDFQSYRRTS